MKQIYVALENGGKKLPVGVIRFDTTQNFGYFTYLPNYHGPALDPINLNYKAPVDPSDRRRRGERVFIVDPAITPGLMHQVFSDSMPGQWGMAVLRAEYPEIRQMKDAEALHWMGSRTTGALSFFTQTLGDETPVRGLEELEATRTKCIEFLARLEMMGLHGSRNPAVASHGGVMPKASYEDSDGRHWIAKFDRPGDGMQTSVLEHAACVMAGRCGVNVPTTRVLFNEEAGNMFLTERFDRDASGRHHRASLMSLTNAKDAGQGDYRDMFRVLKSVCDPVAWPAQRDELLRRMAFNIGLNVTDDHLRNHEMRLTDVGKWELSPAFDLVPVSGPSPHQAAIFGQPRASINLDDSKAAQLWTRIAEELGVTQEHVFRLVDQVASTIKLQWPTLVASIGLNKFNQMFALMATEVGCATPFPSRPTSLTPLSEKVQAELRSVVAVAGRTMEVINGTPTSAQDSTKLSRYLVKVGVEAPRLAQHLQAAGFTESATAMLSASWSAAANAVIDVDLHDARRWLDIAAITSNVTAALNGAQAPRVASEAKADTKKSPVPR